VAIEFDGFFGTGWRDAADDFWGIANSVLFVAGVDAFRGKGEEEIFADLKSR